MAVKRKQENEYDTIQGTPWKNVAYCDNFYDADKKRVKYLSENEKIQVKVKRCGITGAKFVVKLRKDPLLKEKVGKRDKKGKKKERNKRDQL